MPQKLVVSRTEELSSRLSTDNLYTVLVRGKGGANFLPPFFILSHLEIEQVVYMSETRGDLNMKSLTKTIKRSSREVKLPDGSLNMAIGIDALRETSKIYHVPQREVEIKALVSGIVPERYLRNFGSIGIDGQIKLLESTVVIVGVGGLGGTIARNLARVGVGRLILVDGDVFTEDNLNRQEFSYEENIGSPKVEMAAKEIERINSSVSLGIVTSRVGEDDLVKILEGKDAAIDALDNISSRFALGRAAKAVKVPVIHGSVAGFVGQVSTIFPEDGGYDAIYGPQKELPERGVEMTLGSLPGIVGTIAAIQSMEVVKILCGTGEGLRGQLLFIDLENITFEIFKL